MKYRVETAEYTNGVGFGLREAIDYFDSDDWVTADGYETTAEDYIEMCADGPEGIILPVHGDDLHIRIVNDETDEILDEAWVGDIYSKWYGENWKEYCNAE